MKKKLLSAISLLFIINCFSQRYTPIDTNAVAEIKKFKEALEIRHESNIDMIKDEFSGEKKRKLVSIYKDQFETFTKDIEKGSLYYQKENQNYLESVLNEIIVSNPELKSKKIFINFSRDTSPNAYSVGDGTLIVNFDLLNYLDSESELASVICHEISHYVLNHRNKSVTNYVQNMISDETKQEEREIRKQKYNSQKRAEKFVKTVIYSKTSKSREHEIQADSLGVAFLKKTNYNQASVQKLLKHLDDCDKETDTLKPEDYKKFFTTKNQKFIEEWFEKEDFSKYKYSKENIFKFDVDSLKTHPDCSKRIEKIAEYKITESKKEFSVNENYFKKLKSVAVYETIYNDFKKKKYGYCFYSCLKLLNKTPNDPFLQKTMSSCLTLLAKSKKDMKFNSYIPRINPKDQTNAEQIFFNFMNNLTVNEIDRLSKDYEEITKNL